MESLVAIGKITKTHGLNGAVKFLPNSSGLETFLKLKKVFIGKSEDQSNLLKITASKILQNFVLLEFDHISTVELAKKLIHQSVFVTQKDYELLEIDNPEIDWLGFHIFDVNKNKDIGEIVRFDASKAHPIIIVRSSQDYSEIMIPFVEDWVIHLHKKRQIIEMNLPEGLW